MTVELQCFISGVDGVRRSVAGDPADGAIALAQVSARLRQLGDRLTAAQIDNRRTEAAELAGDITGAIEATEAVLNEAGDERSPIRLVAAAQRAWFAIRQGDHQLALNLAAAADLPSNQPSHQLVQAAWDLVAGAANGRVGQFDQAQQPLVQAIGLYERNGLRRETALAHSELGRAEIIAGHLDYGLATHRVALDRALDCGLPTLSAYCPDGLAHALSLLGHYESAALALGASEALRERAGAGITEAEHRNRSAVRDVVIGAIGTEPTFRAESTRNLSSLLRQVVAIRSL